MSDIYLYDKDCSDFSTIGICGRLIPSKCHYEEVANGMAEVTLEHPLDQMGRYTLLVPGRILKAPVPVRTTPEIENGHYVTVVTKYTIKSTATKTQRKLFRKPDDDGVLRTLDFGAEVIAVGSDADSGRLKIKSGRYTGWMDPDGLDEDETVTIPDDAGGIETIAPAWETRDQLFRIYNVVQTDEKVTVNAQHISYDMAYNVTTYNSDDMVTLQAAADGVIENALDKCDAKIYTDIAGEKPGAHYRDKNLIEALLDPDDGLVSRFGAELVRDDMSLYLLHRAGVDRGVRIEYAYNLGGINMSTNVEDVITHVRPVGEDKDENEVYLPENDGLVASPNADLYPFKRIHVLEVKEAKEDKGEGMTLDKVRQLMRDEAQALFDKGADEPKISAKIDFVQMGDDARYAQYRQLRNVYLFDTVHIWHPRLNIDMTTAVTRIKWNCLTERLDDLELGDLEELTTSVSSYQLSGVNGAKLVRGSVSGSKIGNMAIAAKHIQADTINASKLQAESVTTFVLNAVTAKIQDIVARSTTTDELYAGLAQIVKLAADEADFGWATIDALVATVADIANAEIDNADINFAQIKTADVRQLIAQDAVTGKYYIRDLQVDNATMITATVGEMVVKAADGHYYRLDVRYDEDGNPSVTPLMVTPTADEIAAGRTSSGTASIIETDLTVTDLAASNLKGINALIDRLTASRIDVDELFAREATIGKLESSLIHSDNVIMFVVEQAKGVLLNTEIGGRNYELGTQDMADFELSDGLVLGTFDGFGGVTWPQIVDVLDEERYARPGNRLAYDLIRNQPTVASCEIYAPYGTTVTIEFVYELFAAASGGTRVQYVPFTIEVTGSGAWQRITHRLSRLCDAVLASKPGDITLISAKVGQAVVGTAHVDSDVDNDTALYNDKYIGLAIASAATERDAFRVRKIKLETGELATDWTPAPEDTSAELAEALADLEDGLITTYYSVTDPQLTETMHEGDIWYQSATSLDGDTTVVVRRWNSSGGWDNLTDPSIAQALTIARGAADVADRKILTYAQAEAPTGTAEAPLDRGDLWIDIDDNNRLYRWNGAAWADVAQEVEVGGENMLPSSAFSVPSMTTADTGPVSGYGTVIVPAENFPALEPDTTYTFSWTATYEAAHAGGTNLVQRVFGLRIYSATAGTVAASINDAAYDTLAVGGIVSHSVTFTTPAVVPDDLTIQYHTRRWRDEGSTRNYFDTFHFGNIQLERGSVRTDYAPAAADVVADIDAAQAAADAAQADAGSNGSRLREVSELLDDTRQDVYGYMSFDYTEGLVIRQPKWIDSQGVEHDKSIWSTVTDAIGYHIRRDDLAEYVFSAYRDRVRLQNLEIGDMVIKKSVGGGMVWVKKGNG